jgi:hypothetical protein
MSHAQQYEGQGFRLWRTEWGSFSLFPPGHECRLYAAPAAFGHTNPNGVSSQVVATQRYPSLTSYLTVIVLAAIPFLGALLFTRLASLKRAYS